MDATLCPKMKNALSLLGKKWNGLIVYALLDGPKKFTEMEKFINGISARMLVKRLVDLEGENIVVKNVYPTTPVKIEYKLTEKGIDLSNTYKAISNWAEKWN